VRLRRRLSSLSFGIPASAIPMTARLAPHARPCPPHFAGFSAGGPSPEPAEPEVEPATPDVDVMEEEDDGTGTDEPWVVILFNDEVHTFEEVIGQLVKATGCSKSKAEDLALTVHNEGKAEVYEGTFEECFEVQSVLKEIQLVTEIRG
jgi:ATP-dependent Clp protease adapter protein ClpS